MIFVAHMTEEEKRIQQGLRLEEFYKSLNFNGKTFAKDIGCSQSLISPVVNGKKEISRWLINKITKRHTSFNEGWLLTGIGDMNLPASDDTGDKLNEPVAVYEKAEKDTEPFEMLRIWKESFEQRIKELEAEVARMRGLLEGKGKGGEG